ncbi:hypothetical protein GCM10010470_41670 [Saccharopolyspora taberi]|uniref:Uncharacterized protein n=1 Tax=Saccharopolyspora taberi TaxID=60895 RepID=A0ABN3VHP8_9PSEU
MFVATVTGSLAVVVGVIPRLCWVSVALGLAGIICCLAVLWGASRSVPEVRAQASWAAGRAVTGALLGFLQAGGVPAAAAHAFGLY